MKTYNLHLYDVWGNADDGYEVNDVYPSHTSIELAEGFTDEDVKSALREACGCQTNRVTIEDSGAEDCIYINSSEDGKPLGELRAAEGAQS